MVDAGVQWPKHGADIAKSHIDFPWLEGRGCKLTSKVAAIVPCGTNPGEFNEQSWLDFKHSKSIARFTRHALGAADEALKDANWIPSSKRTRRKP
ncbi:beta-ketoacyl synthase [Artemisia annua]|uniref:Beta-ketoacyl synthase n=1 Tax=Artemisia annua TaxID=35608 RepID=A0A2U1NYQ4_ARTAN|nr:beta-ketoacyl synthase [Artemisia annua]